MKECWYIKESVQRIAMIKFCLCCYIMMGEGAAVGGGEIDLLPSKDISFGE